MDAQSAPPVTRIKGADSEDRRSSSKTDASSRTAKIRALNDQLRKTGEGGMVVMTPGIQSLEPARLAKCVNELKTFDWFSDTNDPWHEHDFGSFECEGHIMFFKIDYYDLDLTHHSPDASDETVTKRVPTLMLASEY